MQESLVFGPGFRSGSLVVIKLLLDRYYGSQGKSYAMCLVECSCGKQYKTYSTQIKRRVKEKCKDCALKELSSRMKLNKNRLKHGLHGTSEYSIWENIKYRCNNSNAKFFRLYGGRGIKICEEWSNDFMNFLKDVGERPFPKAQLDRIDPDGNYCPENVRWVTPQENSKNTRWAKKNRDRFVMIDKHKLCDSCRNTHARQ